MVEAGEGPAVLLLHGFPMYWWTWRRQLRTLAEAGYRAIAMDLRGYAGSDHPPRGYDPLTLAHDAAGVIRSLGEQEAVIVGHGWGGFIAWTTAVVEPEAVRAIVPVSMPHPRRLRTALLRDGLQRRESMYALAFQVPFLPERRLTRHDAIRVGHLLRTWSHRQEWLTPEVEDMFRSAYLLWPTAHCAVEYHRWALRSVLRSDGRRYSARMRTPIACPVLQVHGAEDSSLLARSAQGSAEWVAGPYEFTLLDEVGHFPHEEDGPAFDETLLRWLHRL